MLTRLLYLRRTLVNMIILAYMSTQLCLRRTLVLRGRSFEFGRS